MHEYSLYGTIAHHEHGHVKQQLAGIARMQPQYVQELHLIFRASQPLGLANLPSAGGSQGIVQQDVQKIKTRLNAGLYHIQVVGRFSSSPGVSVGLPDANRAVNNDQERSDLSALNVQWTLEFKDTPDPGKQAVSTRLVSRIPLTGGALPAFLQTFGYEYVSRYLIRGYKLYDLDTTLFVHEVLQLPQVEEVEEALDLAALPSSSQLQSIDPGQKHILQVSVDVADGNHPELKERATQQLLSMRDTLRSAVKLGSGDRLALDTKVVSAPRRL